MIYKDMMNLSKALNELLTEIFEPTVIFIKNFLVKCGWRDEEL